MAFSQNLNTWKKEGRPKNLEAYHNPTMDVYLKARPCAETGVWLVTAMAKRYYVYFDDCPEM